jgi:hypothetical protein
MIQGEIPAESYQPTTEDGHETAENTDEETNSNLGIAPKRRKTKLNYSLLMYLCALAMNV